MKAKVSLKLGSLTIPEKIEKGTHKAGQGPWSDLIAFVVGGNSCWLLFSGWNLLEYSGRFFLW